MRNSLTILSLVAFNSCFSQSSETAITLTKIPSPEQNTTHVANSTSDEGTNDPILTGSVKKIINGIEVYVKETEQIRIEYKVQ